MPDHTRLSEAKRKLLELQRRGSLAPASIVPPAKQSRTPSGPAPLSPAQEQVWRLDQTAAKLAALHNESITIHRHGPCDVAALERAFAEIIRRHEIWRTTFEIVNGQPVQMVHPAPAAFSLATSDVRSAQNSAETGPASADSDPAEHGALELATQDARLPFDLSRGPLLRARLVTLSEHAHRLYLTAHQSIVDGVTVYDVFPSELTALYESFAAGGSSPLAELELQFADFALWQRQRTQELREKQLAYWQKQLAGDLPVLAWPNGGTRPPAQTYRGAIHPFTFGKELTESLRELARGEGVTLFMALLAGLTALLNHYISRGSRASSAGQRLGPENDILLGTLAPSGRKYPEFRHLLGYFLNPAPLRLKWGGDPSFRELLQQARAVTLGAISNDDVTLEMMAERLGLKPDPARHPFFTVALSVAPDVAELPPGWSMTFMDVESGGARWDLYLELSDRAGGVLGRAQYNPDLFPARTIAGLIGDWAELLERAATDPTQRLGNLAAQSSE